MNLKPRTKSIEIRGRVIHGDHYGKVLGFPTANLDRRGYTRRKLELKFGVYSGYAEIAASSKQQAARKYKAAIVIGPVDKRGLPKIEAHLLNFTGDLYGRYIHLYIQKYIRPFKRYETEEALKDQIKKDIQKIKKLEI